MSGSFQHQIECNSVLVGEGFDDWVRFRIAARFTITLSSTSPVGCTHAGRREATENIESLARLASDISMLSRSPVHHFAAQTTVICSE
jgi:hypothetical protein